MLSTYAHHRCFSNGFATATVELMITMMMISWAEANSGVEIVGPFRKVGGPLSLAVNQTFQVKKTPNI